MVKPQKPYTHKNHRSHKSHKARLENKNKKWQQIKKALLYNYNKYASNMSGKISQMIQEMKNPEESDGSAPECLKHVGRHNPIPGLLRLHGLECLPHQGFLLQTIEPSGTKAPCSHGGPQRHVVVCHLNVINLSPRALPIRPWSSSYGRKPISKFLEELVRGRTEATLLD